MRKLGLGFAVLMIGVVVGIGVWGCGAAATCREPSAVPGPAPSAKGDGACSAPLFRAQKLPGTTGAFMESPGE
jgi:hypothetical protein